MAITAVIVGAIFYFAFAWWNSDAQSYAAVTKLFKPPKLALTLVDGNRLAIRPSPADQDWLEYRVMDGIVPDHGHLMHLYAIREPGMDAVFHLHPSLAAPGDFRLALPTMPPGNYTLAITGASTQASGGFRGRGGDSSSSTPAVTFQPFSQPIVVTDADLSGFAATLTPVQTQ